MPLMPAFHRRKKDAAIVGRLITGYGELELLLAICVGTALATKRNIPDGYTEFQHRHRYEGVGIKLIFRIRGEKNRIDAASKLMRGAFTAANMGSEYDETMNAMRACLRIRNLFAHCHWGQSRKRGLFFINLEEVARKPQRLNLDSFRHASTTTLQYLERYFWHTMEPLDYLAHELGFRAKLSLPHGLSKPRKMREPNPDTSLFPHRSPQTTRVRVRHPRKRRAAT